MRHKAVDCGLYKRPMVCEECGGETDSLGTRHSDWAHVCWPCLGKTNVGQALAELNEQRRVEAEKKRLTQRRRGVH